MKKDIFLILVFLSGFFNFAYAGQDLGERFVYAFQAQHRSGEMKKSLFIQFAQARNPLEDKQGDVSIHVHVGTVKTEAVGNSSASTSIGVAGGGDATVNVTTKSVVSTTARLGCDAATKIGSVRSDANTNVNIRGPIITDCSGWKDSSTTIGSPNSGNASTSIRGTVINEGGDLVINSGGACAIKRDGKCCLMVHMTYCVISLYPRPPDKPCLPGYDYSIGLCLLYADKHHHIIK